MTDVADDHADLADHVGPKFTKFTPRPVRTSEGERMKRAEQEAKKMAQRANEYEGTSQLTHSTIQEVAEPQDITMTDAPTDNAVTNEDLSGSAPAKLPFLLKHCLPKVGMLYLEIGHNKNIVGERFWNNDEVVRALWSQGKTKDKKVLQALVVPVFDSAVLKIQNECLRGAMGEQGSFQGGGIPEDNYSYEESREADMEKTWVTFLMELRDQLPKDSCMWVRRMSKERFVGFFSLLADARLRETCYPKNDGREHPELVCAITRFLNAAAEAGTPWLMAYAEDEDDEDEDDENTGYDDFDEFDGSAEIDEDDEEDQGGY